MTRRSRLWTVIAGLFTIVNVAGAGFAIALREPLHAATHLGLLLVGYVVWKLLSRTDRLDPAQETEQRLELLQQSVDAIALEVERISEAQRFSARLAAERIEKSSGRQHPS
jgi:hypothetical protein